MMKLLNFLVRRPDLSREEFLDHWRNVHGELIRKHAETIKIRRYVQIHPNYPEAVEAQNSRRGDLGKGHQMEYDGVVELWFDSVEDFLNRGASDEAKRALAEIVADEPNFVDRIHSYTFVGDEVEIVPLGD